MSDLLPDHLSQKFQDAIDMIQEDTSRLHCDSECKYYETLGSHVLAGEHSGFCYPPNSITDVLNPVYNWTESLSYSYASPDVPVASATDVEGPQMYPVFTSKHNGKARKKLRLYEFLYEAIHDVNMAESIQWVDRNTGTFHFVSKNKERLAENWGKRKGNRKTMTYQKMARALRNYSRTGEIVKIRRKLTYQFNPVILQRLSTAYTHGRAQGHAPHETHFQQCPPSEHVYYEMLPPDWHSWYGYYPSDNNCDPAFRQGSH